MDDAAIAMVEAAQAGNVKAAEQLFGRYAVMARRIAQRTGCRTADLEDILQDAVVQALVWFPTLRQPRAFSTWYGQIIVFVTRAHHRRHMNGRDQMMRHQAATTALDAHVDPLTPETLAEARELSDALGRLPHKVRLAVRMRHVEGRQLDEIAEELGVSRASVKRYLASAESTLRQTLRHEQLPCVPGRPTTRQRGLVLLLGARRRLTSPVRGLAGATAALALLVVGSSERPPSVRAAAGWQVPRRTGTLVAAVAHQHGAEDADTGDGSSPSDQAPGSALAADGSDGLIESMGVNVRLGEDVQDRSLVHARLQELGIRHVLDVQGSRLDWLADLAGHGIRTNLFIETDADAHAVVVDAARLGPFVEAITFKQERPAHALAAWSKRQREWMEISYRRLKSDVRTRHLAVVGTTIADDDKRHALGDVSAFVDFAAIGAPSRQLPPGGAFLDATVAVYRPVYGAKPLMVPQVTYSTARCDTCLDERTQAKYTLRTFFESHRRRIVRTYGSYLFDRTPSPEAFEAGMGLLRHDGARKTSFEALARTVRLFADRGPAFTPGTLAVEVQDAPEEVEHALFQKRDGTFLLAFWLSMASGRDDVSAVVRLRPGPGVRPLRAHRLLSGEVHSALALDDQGLLALSVSDQVIVVELESAVGPGKLAGPEPRIAEALDR